MKLSCSSWSYHRTFDEKKMDQLGWIDQCASLELDGVELLGHHFPSKDKDDLRRLKKACTDRFLSIAMVSAGGHLTVSDDQERTKQIEQIRQWVDVAAFLGAPRVRFFCGSGDELRAGGETLYNKVRDAVGQIARIGEANGIVMALENHGGTSADQVLRLLNDVNNDYLKLTLDVGNFPPTSHVGPDTYNSIRRCAPHASIVHAKFFNVRDDGSDSEFDWHNIHAILRQAEYRGFLSVEYEGPDADEIAVMKRIVKFLRQFR